MEMNEQIINGLTLIEYKKSNIFVIKNCLDASFCEEVIETINKIPLMKAEITEGNNVECNFFNLNDIFDINDESYYKITTNNKQFKILLDDIQNGKNITTNCLNGITNKKLLIYKEKIDQYLLLIEKIMVNVNKNINFKYNSGYTFRKITGRTRLHKDGINKIHESQEISFLNNNIINGSFKAIRNASIIFSLNENYEGGIFNFPYYNVSVKLGKGDVILFPPYWTHYHEVSKLENKTLRYTISTWLCEEVLKC